MRKAELEKDLKVKNKNVEKLRDASKVNIW